MASLITIARELVPISTPYYVPCPCPERTTCLALEEIPYTISRMEVWLAMLDWFLKRFLHISKYVFDLVLIFSSKLFVVDTTVYSS